MEKRQISKVYLGSMSCDVHSRTHWLRPRNPPSPFPVPPRPLIGTRKRERHWSAKTTSLCNPLAESVTEKCIELEFLKSLWGLGTEEESGYRTGPPGYIGWWNSFLGIDSCLKIPAQVTSYRYFSFQGGGRFMYRHYCGAHRVKFRPLHTSTDLLSLPTHSLSPCTIGQLISHSPSFGNFCPLPFSMGDRGQTLPPILGIWAWVSMEIPLPCCCQIGVKVNNR